MTARGGPDDTDVVRLRDELQGIADEHDFSGVFAVSRDGQRLVELARGYADRANGRPITLDTRFAVASAVKGFTALAMMSLIESGELSLETTIRSLLPDALPMVDPAVTIEQLLDHTSGIGDYLDEEAHGDVDAYVMPVPVHQLDEPMHYLPVLDGRPQRTPPGATFAYNNGGFVLLSIAIEIASGRSYYDLVDERVFDPAGMADTAFERSDRLPHDAAIGYLEDGRSNVLHLPVRGAGDGGAYSTVRDLEVFWPALFAGRIVPVPVLDRMVEPRNDVPSEGRQYGLGFWLRPDRPTVQVEGMDAGVSCRSVFDRPSTLSYTVISNTSSGVWPLVEYLDDRLPSLTE